MASPEKVIPARAAPGAGLDHQRSTLAAVDVHSGLYLTPEDVAELLQVSTKTVSRMSLADASMPVLRLGRVVRFHRERLMAWLERQEPRSARRQGARTAQAKTDAA